MRTTIKRNKNMTANMDTSDGDSKGPALVFGASGTQGKAVIRGFVENGKFPVYGVSRQADESLFTGATLLQGDFGSVSDIERILSETHAQAIFVVTTTELPVELGGTGYQAAADVEYQAICDFFHTLIKVFETDGLKRHVVLSTYDNVQRVCQDVFELTGKTWIEPLDDGSIVPHYSGKGRAGEEAMELLDGMDGLSLTCLTLPFLHSNFLGFFTPLPNAGETQTQWTISACFGDNHANIDMLSASDLAYIVPQVIQHEHIYSGKNLRIAAESLTMEQVASMFSDLFGKDVIYNPLSVEQVSSLPIPAAACMAQMCQFLGDSRSLHHDVELTEAIMFPRKPQVFKDWLLVHSDDKVFEEAGLSVDGKEITSVTVFGATSLQGTSVVKGLLRDERKKYTVRATTRHLESKLAKQLKELDPRRVELVYADFDDVESCQAAVDGVDGAFLVTDFFQDAQGDMEVEERHARNVIDACEASHSVRHLVFSTLESVDEMNKKLQLGLEEIEDSQGNRAALPSFDAKAKAAAYARTKNLSVTYVLMPCYSEMFFDLLKVERRMDEDGGERFVITVPMQDDTKLFCMSVEDLGPAVANIFDSYQVYAGHEIGLVTDYVTVSEVADIVTDVYSEQSGEGGTTSQTRVLEKEEVETDKWIEAQDTYMKDFGQMFAYMASSPAVKKRRSIAQTLQLVPNAQPLKEWIRKNKDDPDFREKLGLR
jgi:nucleoside-diphosphate-sugar epimerase